MVSFKAYFNPAVGVHDDRHRVAIKQGLVQRILALVNPLFLVLDTLATPRVAQTIGGRSNGQGVDHRDICHFGASSCASSMRLGAFWFVPFYNGVPALSLSWEA